MPKIVWVIAAAVALSFALRKVWMMVGREVLAIVIDEAIRAEKSDIDEFGSGSFPRGEA